MQFVMHSIRRFLGSLRSCCVPCSFAGAMAQNITQAMALHATRKKRENLVFGSVKSKQKRLDALARIEKDERREKEREKLNLIYNNAATGAEGCLVVEQKRCECKSYGNIRWDHFDCNLRSYQAMDAIAARHAEFKVGVSTCQLWRMYHCTGHGTMIAHCEVGWACMYIVAYQVASAAGATESRLISYFRDSKCREALRNTANGADGFDSRSAKMYYVYIIAT